MLERRYGAPAVTRRVLSTLALAAAVALAYVWVGYPALVGLLAAVRPRRPRRRGAARPAVSVVLATREPEGLVRARVDDLLRAAYDAGRLEVVVAVDASGAGGGAAMRMADPRVRVVTGDAPGGKAAALNAGVRAATGDLLVFADTHQRFEPAAVAALVAALDDPRVGAASGALELPAGATATPLALYWRLELWLRRTEARVHSTVGVSGAIWAMRRALWRPLPPGLLLDDVYTPMRLVLDGHRVAFADGARAVETRAGGSAEGEYRRKVRTLTGNLQLCAWLPALLLPWRNPIWLQFVSHKLLRLLTPYLAACVSLWAGVAAGRVAWAHPWPAVALGAAAVVVAGLVRPVRQGVRLVALMHAALVMATLNGLRGRWDVWQR